jgi:hypothetical protein
MKVAIVSGALANKPRNGGEAWVRLSWVLGLRRLGFDTYFVEQVDADNPIGRGYFEAVAREFDLVGSAALLRDDGEEVAGLGFDQLGEIAGEAVILVNLSGHLTLEPLRSAPRTSVYVDLDPGFTQAWHADPRIPFRIPRHDHYVTVGLNLGAPECLIPDCGLRWVPTLPPVVLERWPRRPPPRAPLRFSTVATWRSPNGSLRIGGRTLGLKHHQFRRLIELPEQVEEASFEIALDIHPGDAADLQALRSHGWEVVEPSAAAGSPESFREYVGASGAEFSVAQGVYAETASGWFSDRTAAYLASGRPALVQETGIAARLPVGAGLLTFGDRKEAVSAARRLAAEPEAHAAAARVFAERHLDSDRVLERLLGSLGVKV